MATQVDRPSRSYPWDGSVVFHKTTERFGQLSNMAAGFPLRVNGTDIRTSEALYQACRFPLFPAIQREILLQNSPMVAKMKSKKQLSSTRSDWLEVRHKVMRWCLRVKLAQHYETFGALLLQTGDAPIVERSRRDSYWGAIASVDDAVLQGENVLGRLLMELRDKVKKDEGRALKLVPPLEIPSFLLLGEPICKVEPFELPSRGLL